MIVECFNHGYNDELNINLTFQLSINICSFQHKDVCLNNYS